MFKIPYRWFYRYEGQLRHCVGRNLSYMWSDFRNGVKNILRWVPRVWFDVDWQYDSLLEIMETKLSWMAKSSKKWNTVNSGRAGRQMRVCAALLKRIREDEYFENAGYSEDSWPSLHSYRKSQIAKHAIEQRRRDLEYFGKIFTKHVLRWWD